uniref:Serine/threonine-protein kinase greatwall n=1 Tax=Clastoptera arizonana TaxID=38151 RepID=A0A1B6C2G5_9HEMI
MMDIDIIHDSKKKVDSVTKSHDLIFKTLAEQLCHNSKAPVIDDFTIVKPISRGAYGKVFLGYKTVNPKQLFAIKVMKKDEMINKNMVSQVVSERNALALIRSPFCVQLFYSLQTLTSVYLVMEYMVGGDLKCLLSRFGFFDEGMATFYAAEIILALEYLHRHSIVHRDLKPDNMLLSASGHLKLTDFGLSRISIHRDLEIEDLVSGTPHQGTTRTPGQLLSLTSHLSFGSNGGTPVNPNSEKNVSLNSTRMSGVSPFHSAEHSFTGVKDEGSFKIESSLSYHTCEGCSSTSCICISTNGENLYTPSPLSRTRSFKRPGSMRDRKRKRPALADCVFSSPVSISQTSTGLSQSINYLEISQNLLKRNKNDNPASLLMRTPLKSVLKNRCLSDEEPKPSVKFSTPVSFSARRYSDTSFVKSTRFNLPDLSKNTALSMEDIAVSPIATPHPGTNSTSSNQTPFRTPKSVKRGRQVSDQRILGTPDYLAPELLLRKGYGPSVDWWALGVCMYEFMTGVLPFNDETPQLVFANILNRVLEWPEGDEALSDSAFDTINALLTLDPDLRPSGQNVKGLTLFENTDWENLTGEMPPFVPQPNSSLDTSYFQEKTMPHYRHVSNFDL